jgi:hypothetical protein
MLPPLHPLIRPRFPVIAIDVSGGRAGDAARSDGRGNLRPVVNQLVQFWTDRVVTTSWVGMIGRLRQFAPVLPLSRDAGQVSRRAASHRGRFRGIPAGSGWAPNIRLSVDIKGTSINWYDMKLNATTAAIPYQQRATVANMVETATAAARAWNLLPAPEEAEG